MLKKIEFLTYSVWEDPIKSIVDLQNILCKKKIKVSPYYLVIPVRHFKTFFLWSRENIKYT